jgi:hypothetical protein
MRPGTGRWFWVGFTTGLLATLALVAGVAWLVSATLISPPREKFVSSTFDFELPEGWGCDEEGGETVCTIGRPPHDAIVILARKMRGPMDTLDGYAQHLEELSKTSRAADDPAGGPVREVHRTRIGEHEWVESVQHGSEVAGYLTRYLATVTSHIGVLLTVSVRADQEERHRPDVAVMVGSLVIHERE